MAITTNYYWPVATPGTTTPPLPTTPPPTIPTSSVRYNDVVVQLTGDGVSTTVTITHNLELTAQELAADFPEIHGENLIASAPSGEWILSKTSNTVTLGYSGTSVSTFRLVRIRRPQTATR